MEKKGKDEEMSRKLGTDERPIGIPRCPKGKERRNEIVRRTNGKGKIVRKVLGAALCTVLVLNLMPTTRAQSDNKTCYVALGDSISSGYGLEEEEQRFTQQVASQNGCSLISLAENGETSAALLERLADPATVAAVKQADVISITVGGNDLLHALYAYLATRYQEQNPSTSTTEEVVQTALMGGDMEMVAFALGAIPGFSSSDQEQEALSQFEDHLTQVVEIIQSANPQACLVVANQYNPYSYLVKELSKNPFVAAVAQSIADAFSSGVSELNTVMASVGEREGCAVADVYGKFESAQENPCNAEVSASAQLNLDFHPNAYGHSLIAQAVTAAVHQQLRDMGDGAQAVNGETTTISQISHGGKRWKWAIPMGAMGVGAGMVALWWSKRRSGGRDR